mgnify:CR=1 FL=1
MIDFLNEIDTSVFLFFNGMHAPFLDRFMTLFTGRFIWIPMYATILLQLIRHSDMKRAWIYALGIGLAILLTDQLCASYIRPFFERLRPSNPRIRCRNMCCWSTTTAVAPMASHHVIQPTPLPWPPS